MSVEQDIAELKTDIKWIKESIKDIKRDKQLNKGYLIGLIGSIVISLSSILITVIK